MEKSHSDVKIVDNVFVKLHHMTKAYDKYSGHAHTFDHITLLATGSVIMRRSDAEDQQYEAPQLIVTPKGVVHEFIALEPNTLFCCIHAIRDGDGVDDVASQDITPEEAFNLLTTYTLVTK